MKRTRLPRTLDLWLENRGFNYLYPDKPNYLNEDEIFSAAFELFEDMYQIENIWYDTPYIDKSVLYNFIKRESKTHKRLPLFEWYHKGN